MNEIDLLPCPFCGGQAETITGPVPRKWGVRCINCDVWRDDRCESEGDAIASWNRRAALPARGVGVDAVLDAAHSYLMEQYGSSPLGHPADRARILAALPDIDTFVLENSNE